MGETLALRGSFSCDRVQDPEPPSPLRGEGWDEGDKGFMVHPHLNPPPSKGEDIIEEITNIFG